MPLLRHQEPLPTQRPPNPPCGSLFAVSRLCISRLCSLRGDLPQKLSFEKELFRSQNAVLVSTPSSHEPDGQWGPSSRPRAQGHGTRGYNDPQQCCYVHYYRDVIGRSSASSWRAAAPSAAIHSSCSPPDSSDCLAVLLCAPLKGGHTFSRDSSMVALYSRHTRALTVANFSQRAPARLCPRRRREQQVLFLQVCQKRVTDLACRNPIKSLSSCDIKK